MPRKGQWMQGVDVGCLTIDPKSTDSIELFYWEKKMRVLSKKGAPYYQPQMKNTSASYLFCFCSRFCLRPSFGIHVYFAIQISTVVSIEAFHCSTYKYTHTLHIYQRFATIHFIWAEECPFRNAERHKRNSFHFARSFQNVSFFASCLSLLLLLFCSVAFSIHRNVEYLHSR